MYSRLAICTCSTVSCSNIQNLLPEFNNWGCNFVWYIISHVVLAEFHAILCKIEDTFFGPSVFVFLFETCAKRVIS